MQIWNQLAGLSFFETDRLSLRPFVYSDWQNFYQIVGKQGQLPFVFPYQASPEEARSLLVQLFLKEPLGKWAIVDKESAVLIGALSLENLSMSKHQAELGYFLHADYRGKGLMTELVTHISSSLLSETDLDSLFLVTHLENTASQAVARKAGFKLVKRYKGSDRYTHQMRTYLLFRKDAIVKE